MEALTPPLPSNVSPFDHDDPCMSFHSVVQWIASEGGKRTFDIEEISKWMDAYNTLLTLVIDEVIIVTGYANGDASEPQEPVPASHFRGLSVSSPFFDAHILQVSNPEDDDCPEIVGTKDLRETFKDGTHPKLTGREVLVSALSDKLVMSMYPYLDYEHWFGGMNDKIEDRTHVAWSHLLIRKSDVAEHWPFEHPTNAINSSPSLAKKRKPTSTAEINALVDEMRIKFVQFRAEYQDVHGRHPTTEAEEAWRLDVGIPRQVLRDLQRTVDRNPRGAPKKHRSG